MSKHTKVMAKSMIALGLTAAVAIGSAASASANRSATTSGASVNATGWYRLGVHSRGTVTDTRADGHCAYAQVKLALDNYNDYTFNKAQVCGNGNSKSWNHTGILADVGPVLSSFNGSAIQGVYVRACIDNRTWPAPDTCGPWARIGGNGSSSAL